MNAATSKGFWAWHVHHGILLEWCYDEQGRRDFIDNHKPPEERELRQRLFKKVQGELPEAYVKAREADDKAGEAYVKAWEAYDKAWEACKEEILALHAKECPNCPWDGETIFPKPKDVK